jgi:hypothetical protein
MIGWVVYQAISGAALPNLRALRAPAKRAIKWVHFSFFYPQWSSYASGHFAKWPVIGLAGGERYEFRSN